MVERFQNYIGGKFVDAGDGRTFDSLDPYAGEPWAAIPEGSTEDIDHAVAAARSALDGEWGAMTGFQRAALMRRLADLITENAERLARVEVRDNGKLYREMIGQLQGLGAWYQLLRRARRQDRGPGHPDRQAQLLLLHPPRAGRRGRRDHAVELPAAADDVQARPGPGRGLHVRGQALGALPRVDAGLRPGAARGRASRPGVFNVVAGSSRELGAALAGHKGVDKVAFTGSTATGRAVAHAAADNVNRVTLELGGKSPQIVFEDADLRRRGQRHHRRASSPPPARPAWPGRG